MTREELYRLAWETGRLDRILLDENQRGIRAFINNMPPEKGQATVICSRQIGKTRTLLTDAFSFCLRTPDAVVYYVTGTAKAAKRIVKVGVRPILVTCPKDLAPKFNAQDLEYRFPNGSTLMIAGLDLDGADRIRGTPAHRWYVDEARNVADLDYTVSSILGPATLTTGGIGVLASTPPKASSHDLVSYIHQAQADGTYIQRTVYDCPRLSPEQIELQKARTLARPGGELAWRVEYLCELLRDEERAVVPEFKRDSVLCEPPPRREPHLDDVYGGYDYGFARDWAGLLVSHWDFARQVLVVTGEWLKKGASTDETGEAMKALLARCYPSSSGGHRQPYLMVGDAPDGILHDLGTRHGLWMAKPRKDRLTAEVASLRSWVNDRKLVISPDCPQLARQLEEAVWEDSGREKIDRTAEGGHADLLMALVYLVRAVVENRNPYPPSTDYTERQRPRTVDVSPAAQALAGIFGRHRR